MTYSRSTAPVFVVGSPRSGTTLLYHMLLSAGGFARYRAETHVFNTLAPRYGGMRREQDVAAALTTWIASDCHTLSGLSANAAREAVLGRARNAGEFLRLLMDRVAAQQGVPRWAETTPAHLLHMREIAEQIPGALFVHVIRDGRDVATSLERQRWIRPLPMDRERPVLAAAAYWEWIVRRGRDAAAMVRDQYIEVRYEALVDDPAQVLHELEPFLQHRLDWTEISRVGVGSVGRPNTSFPNVGGGFRDRWRTQLAPRDADAIDAMLSFTLRELGYPSTSARRPLSIAARRSAYHAWFSMRDWLKRRTALGRRSTNLSHFEPGSMIVSEEKLAGVTGDSTS